MVNPVYSSAILDVFIYDIPEEDTDIEKSPGKIRDFIRRINEAF